MIELFEKTLLAGMGALTLTQQKAEELVDELKSRLDMSEEKGRELLDRLQQTAKESQKKLEDAAQQEVRKACERVGVATSEELKTLQKKVQKLEKELKAIKG